MKKKITRRPRAQRESEILAAAAAAFARHGYDGTVMADVAAQAGIAEGTVYKLFDSKQALLYRVMEDWYAGFTAELEKLLRGIALPVDRMRTAIWYHLQLIHDDAALCRVFFREIRAFEDYRGSAMYELNQKYTGVVVGILEDGVAVGVFRDDVPISMMRDTLYGGLEHCVWSFLAGEKSLDVADTTEHFLRLILGGAGTQAANAGNEQLQPLVARLEQVANRLEQRADTGDRQWQ